MSAIASARLADRAGMGGVFLAGMVGAAVAIPLALGLRRQRGRMRRS